jgi:hypothetical protein
MATPQEFGKAILIMQAEDSQLAATLKKDEALVTASVGKMQGKINTLSVSQGNLGDTAGAASASVATLGAVASVTGSRSVIVAAQVGQLTVAMIQQANATELASAAIKKFALRIGAFIVSPAGLAIAAIAAGVGFLAFKWSKLNEGVEEAIALEQKATDKLKAQTEAIDKQAAALERQIKLLGGVKPSELEGNTRLRNLLIEKESLEVANKLRTESEAQEKALSGRIAALEKETRLLTGEQTALEQIVSIDERRATAARDRAKANKDAADALRTEAATAENLRRSQGFLTPAEARERVNLAATEQAGALERQRALRAALADRFNLDLQFKLAELDTQQRKLAEALGLRGDAARQGQRGGAIASTAFTTGSAGLFASVQAVSPAQMKRNRESAETAKAAGETAKNTKRMVRLMGTTGGLGP